MKHHTAEGHLCCLCGGGTHDCCLVRKAGELPAGRLVPSGRIEAIWGEGLRWRMLSLSWTLCVAPHGKYLGLSPE